MRTLAIAVAGAGAMGRQHMALVRAHPACELAAIVDTAPSAGALAAAAGVPLHDSLAQLFAARRPDAVILATPNAAHVPQALECIAAGVPALIEKPVADTVRAGMRLCDAAERTGVRLLVGHHRRHSAIVASAVAVVQSGALGDLVAVTGSALFYKPDAYFDEGPWRRQPGGGPLLINMIHDIASLRALCGEIVAVQALASNARRRFAVEDTVSIVLRFASGALGTFVLSDTAAAAQSWEQTSGENPVYARYPDEDCYVVAGTRGSLGIPTLRLRAFGDGMERSWRTPMATHVLDVPQADPLVRQLDHFCAVVRGEAAPLVTVRDALQNVRVVEAIGEAARTGRTVATG
ncbi:MAG: Gfo/Idh/MocA family protein [Betaproteobacteria bacterium]